MGPLPPPVLPALSILTAVVFRRVLATRGFLRPVMRLVATAGLAWTLVIGPLLTVGMLQDYGKLRRMRDDHPVLLSFDPFLNFVSGTEPACDVTDPLAQFSRPFFQDSPRFMRFVRSTDQVIACLEEHPDVRVLVSTLQGASLWFIDEQLYAWLQRQRPPRALYLDERSRIALIRCSRRWSIRRSRGRGRRRRNPRPTSRKCHDDGRHGVPLARLTASRRPSWDLSIDAGL